MPGFAIAMTPTRPAEDRRTSQEIQLLEHLQRLAKFRGGRRSVHIHLSRLRPANRRGDRVRIALNTFEFLVRHFEGQIFALTNGDIVFVFKGGDLVTIDEAVMRVGHLFADDPLTQDIDGEEQPRFCSWYDLEADYTKFLGVALELAEEERKRAQRLSAITRAEEERRTQKLLPLTPRQLGDLLDAIERADLSNMMRRQSVCTLLPDASPQPMFRELYISIDVLRSMIMPGYDITGNRWLFQHLTQTLDQRMLQLLSKNDDGSIAAAFSLNLNVATLLSDRFLTFDAGLSAAKRGTIVFELQPIDVFADLGAFNFARDFAKERGYRICLDGVTDLTLPLIDRSRLGFDLVKVVWQPESLEGGREQQLAELRKLVASFGRARTILCRCDSEEAVTLGQSLGITLFQGHHIDKLIGIGTPPIGMQKLRAAAQTLAPPPRR
jgi:hypothetical protein